jgi:predicted RNase H-like HicB family nuclease
VSAAVRIRAKFLQDGDWWVAWTEDVPGAITDGPTLAEARSRLVDEVRRLGGRPLPEEPQNRVVVEELDV